MPTEGENSELEEGWYTDPYGLHDARWISEGQPTKLVRDGSVESYDEPPDRPPTQVPEPIGDPVGSTDDLRRADEAQQAGPYDARQAADEVFDQMTGGGLGME